MKVGNERLRTAILISGRGSNMSALLKAATDDTFPAHIALVMSNRPDADGLVSARKAGIATKVVDHKLFNDDRDAFEQALNLQLDAHNIDLICLAGFMRILTSAFVEPWQGRLINIHPSLLPLFPGTNSHGRAIAAGVPRHGCTVHFVETNVDTGPIIAQASVPVLPDDTSESLGQRVLMQEHLLYPRALAMVANATARRKASLYKTGH